MSPTEHYNHLLVTLKRIPNHTIVRHKNANGTCWRIRDAEVNPVANMPDSVFDKLREKELIHKINDREWQLK